MSAPRKVLQEKQYKGWDKCLWVKCIKGIGTAKEAQTKKSKVFDNANMCPPDLREDHLKITVLKQSPNYPSLFPVFGLFSELQRYERDEGMRKIRGKLFLPIRVSRKKKEKYII
jgi:hypothetical protein